MAACTTDWSSVAPNGAAAFSSNYLDWRGILALTLSLFTIRISGLLNGSHIEPEVHDIPVTHHIFLAFHA
jgi:hypothetical protein